MRFALLAALLCTAPLGCDGDAGGTGAADAGPRGSRLLDVGPGGSDAISPGADAGPGDAAAQVGDGGLPVADAAPAGECAADDDCPADRVCYDSRCIEGTRCGEGATCPAGRVCVADICVADPNATGGLVAEPDALGFSFSSPGDRVVREALVSNVGDLVLQITALEFAGDPTFQVSAIREPGGEGMLPVRLVPGQSIDLELTYLADDGIDDSGTLTVRATAEGAGEVAAEIRLVSDHKTIGGDDPCLLVQPARLNFGAVVRGEFRDLDFEMISCGTAPVRVTDVRRGASIFGALPDTFTLQNPPAFPLLLEPGDRRTVTVRYSPRRAQLEGGFWEVLSNDPDSPQQRVDVSALATPPPLEEVGLHVRLSWDTDLTDVDLHLLGPNGQIWTCAGDCYFSNPNPNWADQNEFVDDPFLDVDDVDGFGPENINLETPAPGTYTVLVQYWDDHDGDEPDATVEVLSFGNVVAAYGPQHLGDVNDEWTVVEIDWPGLALRPVGQMQNRARGALCGGF